MGLLSRDSLTAPQVGQIDPDAKVVGHLLQFGLGNEPMLMAAQKKPIRRFAKRAPTLL
jgi:hypothetical protein